MKKVYLVASVIILLAFNASAQTCPFVYTQWPVNEGRRCDYTPCGIYWMYNVNINSVSHPYKFNGQYFDGIYMKVQWDQLEDQPGVMNLTVMGIIKEVCKFAKNNGKQVSIGIMAGENTPGWVFNPGSGAYEIPQPQPNGIINIQQFGNDKCEWLEHVPIPFARCNQSSGYAAAYNRMMDLFKIELNSPTWAISGKTLYEIIGMIKMCGINMNSDETRIPIEDDSFESSVTGTSSTYCSTTGIHCATNMVNAWTVAGYTPEKLLCAWLEIQQHTKLIFPDKILNHVVIPDPKAFPPIDCYGVNITTGPFPCTISAGTCITGSTPGNLYPTASSNCHRNNYDENNPPYVKVAYEMVHLAAKYFEGCLAVNSTYLTNVPSTAFLSTLYPGIQAHAIIGYQEDYHHDLPNYPGSFFLAELTNALNESATFIELHANTFQWFKDPSLSGNPGGGYANWMAAMYDHFHFYMNCVIPQRLASENTIEITMQDDAIHFMNTGNDKQCHFSIYDLAGRMVADENYSLTSGDNVIEIKNLNLKPAMYVFKMDCGNGNLSSSKLIVR